MTFRERERKKDNSPVMVMYCMYTYIWLNIVRKQIILVRV